ncbi:hypothetical protein L1049_021041 [Liquidambar formosana]|uniref:CTCHY-type domain-containing protein n=1 Tax=Liquidambar formosana TaxID=63359 RepID=A0AAP0SDJ9_LIQFO
MKQRTHWKLILLISMVFHAMKFKRTGGKENFLHCKKCRCCYSKLMKDSHYCVERAMHHNCPVFFEFLFYTTKDILQCYHVDTRYSWNV